MNFLKKNRAFTVAEMVVAVAITAIVGLAILDYGAVILRLISRNLTVNHSHEAVRGSFERMLSDLHSSASVFQLISYNGTSYSDVTATVSTDVDAYSGQFISARANGVRFMKLGGGPYRLVSDGGGATTIASTATTLKFEFGVNGALPYIPAVGDKLQIPLISREFDITAVTAPTAGNTQGTVTISGGTGFTLYTAGTTSAGVIYTGSGTYTSGTSVYPPFGYFYQRVAYTVWNNQLRYHPNPPDPPYPAAATDTPVVVRNNVTSPKPFALLFSGTSAGTLTDGMNLRVSLEAYDLNYSSRLFSNGTTTLQAVIPPRTQPKILSTN